MRYYRVNFLLIRHKAKLEKLIREKGTYEDISKERKYIDKYTKMLNEVEYEEQERARYLN